MAALSGEACWRPLVWTLPPVSSGADADELGASLELDGDGRNRLHHAALSGDLSAAERVAELAAAEGQTLAQCSHPDRWGLTPEDIAKLLGRHDHLRVLNPRTMNLQDLAAARLRNLLLEDGELLDRDVLTVLLPRLGLHEFGLLRLLAQESPESVSNSCLTRAMSCLECWHADLYSKGFAASLPPEMYLISCWEHQDSFQFRDLPDDDGKLLCSATQTSPPTIADRPTFEKRFRDRTGGLLDTIDWSKFMVIGGMVLGCLTCSDETFPNLFAETDVDIYCVGASGKEFQEAVLELLKRLGQQAPRSVVLRTSQTITVLPGRSADGRPLPNIQVILAPYKSPAHLLFTTDLDCTAMGFDGSRLLVTPRAREALARRRNIVRPEKYMVRGEWRTESRYLKYARRGFRVVDLGLTPAAKLPVDAVLQKLTATVPALLEASAAALKRLQESEASLRTARREARGRVLEQVERERRAAGLLAGDWSTSEQWRVRIGRPSETGEVRMRGVVLKPGEEQASSLEVSWDCFWSQTCYGSSPCTLHVRGMYPSFQLKLESLQHDDFGECHRNKDDQVFETYGLCNEDKAATRERQTQSHRALLERAQAGEALQTLYWGKSSLGIYTKGADGRYVRQRSPSPVRWTRLEEPFQSDALAALQMTATDDEDDHETPFDEDDDGAFELGDCAQGLRQELERQQSALRGVAQSVLNAGFFGARLLLLAQQLPALHGLLTHEVPSLRAGLDRDEATDVAFDEDAEDANDDRKDGVIYQGSYGKQRSKMVLVNPAPGQARRNNSRFRNREISAAEAVVELDLESDRFETRDWYDGIAAGQIQNDHASLDPDVWRGIGDFRQAA